MHKNRFLKDEKSFFFCGSLSVIHIEMTKTAALALEPQMLHPNAGQMFGFGVTCRLISGALRMLSW